MATETSTTGGDRLPGAGQAPPVDALQPHGRVRPRRRGARSSSRGEGCYVWDEHGNRYLDGLSALFCVNIGHGRADIAQAGADQAKELGFFTNWSYAHPRAIELAAKIASLAPGDLNRVFFTSGGGEAVESALKLARQYHKLTRQPEQDEGHRARDRLPRHDARRAHRDRHHRRCAQPFEPFTPGGCHVPNTNIYRLAPGYGVEDLAEAIAQRIEFEGPETVAARDPRAGPERRRLLRPARRLLRSACARSATSTTSC